MCGEKLMKLKYKAVMFLTLLIFCIGSVCATEPNNTTSDSVTVDGGLNPVNPPINNTSDIVKMVNSELEKRDIIIQNQEVRIKALENSSAEKDVRINELNTTVNNQSVIINSLKTDNEALKDNNTQLDKRVKDLEYSKLTQSNRIKSLEIDIKNLEDSNKALNNKINNQSDIINRRINRI